MTNKGRLRITLRVGAVKKHKTVHRLVAEAFIPNPENKPQVNHIDGNRTNNSLENLEWCTNSENVLHAVKNNLFSHGEDNYKTHLKTADIIEIREKYKPWKYSTYKLAKEYGVTQMSIYRIVKRASWKHI